MLSSHAHLFRTPREGGHMRGGGGSHVSSKRLKISRAALMHCLHSLCGRK